MVLKILFLLCVKFPGDEERRKRTKQFLLVGMERGFSCGIFQQFYSGRVSVTHCVRVPFFVPKFQLPNSVYLFLVSSRIRETRNEKFIFREISRLVFSKISRFIKEVKLEESSIFKQFSFS